MALEHLAFVQIILGSAIFVLGTVDFRKAAELNSESAFDALDAKLLGHLSDEFRIGVRRSCAALMIIAGLAICLAPFFSRL